MPSGQQSTLVRNSIGYILPAEVVAIANDVHIHPERGRLLDRLRSFTPPVNRELAPAKKKRRVEKSRGTPPPNNNNKFIFDGCTDGGTPIFKGRILNSPSNNKSATECITGYLVSLIPDNNESVIVVIDVPGRGMIPCICPTSMLDEPTTEGGRKKSKPIFDKGKVKYLRTTRKLTIESVSGRIGDDECHLLIDTIKSIKGRLVDKCMLTSLEGGCLRIGTHTEYSAFYTLPRQYIVKKDRLKHTAHLLVDSPQGIILCPAGRSGVNQISNWGELAVDSRLVHHKTLKKAIVALSLAGSLPVPSIDECVLQVAIGGDPDSMMIGNFIPCQGLRNKPNINVRCACGFVVGSSPTVSNNILRHLLRPRCGGIDQNSKCYLLYCFTLMFKYLHIHVILTFTFR